MIPEFDRTRWLFFGANHSQAVRIFRVHRIALLKKDGSGFELMKWSIPQKDVGIEGWIVEGLLLVAVFAAEQVEKTPNVGGDHSALMGPKKNNKKSPPRGAWRTTSTNQIRALMA